MKDKLKRVLNLRFFVPFVFWIIIIGLILLYFTNDFGLVDIHKTSIIVAVGIDPSGDEVEVTAQVAIPAPSQSGDSVSFAEVQGSGITVADALNEINVKTGTYPKLQFCKLILLGEGCKDRELFDTLGCFYRRNFSELTALVAMCKGKAQDMLAMRADIAPENSTSIQKVLSDELKKSANVTVVDLKRIAELNYSVSAACYMPFVEANKQGTSQNGGNGDAVGGENVKGGDSKSGKKSSQGASQENDGSQKSSSGGDQEKVEFTARKTAIFSGGKFKGILSERESFALNILTADIRLAILSADAGETHYTIGIKNASGDIKLDIEGVPKVTLTFKAKAQVQGAKEVLNPKRELGDGRVDSKILDGAEQEVKTRILELVKVIIDNDCDILGIRNLLNKYHFNDYPKFKDVLLSKMQVDCKVTFKSAN